ncbi:MAG: NAD-dependent epimerase/dehydratase family protein [Chloroflexi bacterium]|nr:MAG: NAD-dependent epimerase/dehydratase family protein [Chloroflexota bacterium]
MLRVEVLVTGGTGALGRQVVKRLRERGHRAVVLSRQPGAGGDWRRGDLATGEGLAEAVAGMQGIVHAGSATVQPHRYRVTDLEGTRRLLDLASDAGVRHLVYVSIAGMEGVNYPYYRWKLAAERVVAGGKVPWSTLRATQFHTLLEVFLGGMAAVPGLLMVPFRWQFQPVDTRDVAERLVEVVTGEPGGLLSDYGGPEVRDFKSLAESWLRARRMRRRLLNLPLPFQFSRKFAEGRLLCPEHKDGTITWEQYLGRRYGAAQETAQQD